VSFDESIEFLASSSWDEEMPERLRFLRVQDPVHWSDKDQLFVVTRFEDVVQVSKNQTLFSSAGGVRPGTPVKLAMIDEAEPRHTQVRSLINRGFSPRMVGKLERTFREIVRETLDAVSPLGVCDFVESIAVPLPLLLIAEMIGIRREDRGRFHEWSDAMIAAEGNLGDPEIAGRASRAFVEYAAYLTEIFEDRRRNPRADLASILVHAKDAGTLGELGIGEPSPYAVEGQVELENDELVMMMVLLLVAGNETTRNAISGGMQLLIEQPEIRARLIAEPEHLPHAVEEMLRLVSPVHSFARTVTEDTVLRDTPLAKGDQVLMIYPSANRDEEAFPDPDEFQIDRNPHHVAFGIGSHFCLGANLARMEMRVAFEELLRRMPDMVYAEPEGAVVRPSALVRACTRMAVRFTPGG
jgi:cytochrome P450 family 142 subfamily A polypeptide 1